MDDEQVKGMFEEALIMKQLDDPNVVKIIGIAILRNQPHIIMPFMKNKDLKSHVKNAKIVRLPCSTPFSAIYKVYFNFSLLPLLPLCIFRRYGQCGMTYIQSF